MADRTARRPRRWLLCQVRDRVADQMAPCAGPAARSAARCPACRSGVAGGHPSRPTRAPTRRPRGRPGASGRVAACAAGMHFGRGSPTRELRLYVIACAAMSLALWAFTVVLAIAAYRAGGTGAVTLAVIARVLPGAIAGPGTALLADRHPRRAVLLALTGGATVLLAALAAAAALGRCARRHPRSRRRLLGPRQRPGTRAGRAAARASCATRASWRSPTACARAPPTPRTASARWRAARPPPGCRWRRASRSRCRASAGSRARARAR